LITLKLLVIIFIIFDHFSHQALCA